MTGNDRCGDILSLDGGNDDGYEFCCMLEAGHDGPHRDEFGHEGQSVVITWHNEKEGIREGYHGKVL